MNQFASQLKNAVRSLVRDRGFTIVAVLSIGLGVGANAAIFSLVDQALLRTLPVRHAEQLVLLNWNGRFIGPGWGSANLLPHPMYRDIVAQTDIFEGLFARHPTEVNLAIEQTPEPVRAEIVSGSYFGVLGVQPALGRLIDESDDKQPGAHPVIVLSFDYWKSRFGAQLDVVGRKVRMNDHPMTIVGVAANGFRGVDWAEVPSIFVPTMMKNEATPQFGWLDNRRGRWLHVFGRLKPGMTREETQARLQPWFKAMLDEDMRQPDWPPVTDEQRRGFLASRLELLPAANGRSPLRRQLERPLFVLLAATGLVLLLACLNVANLSLARAFARRRETALRLTLGASRSRIVQELLTESVVLATLGALLGVLLAPLVSGGLISFLPPDVALRDSVDARVFLLALAVAISTGVLFGLMPALQASRADAASTLKEESTTVAGGLGLRRALVTGQVALALILLIGAGLFVRTLHNLRSQGPGFATTNLLTFFVDSVRSGYDQTRGRGVMEDVLAAVRALPDVESATLGSARLLGGGSWNAPMTIEADRRFTTDRSIHNNAIAPGYFATLGAGILAGRDFDERDRRDDVSPKSDSPSFRSAIVNQKFVDRYLQGKNPIGVRVGFGNRPDTRADLEIVGVVSSFSYRGVREIEEQAFVPYFEAALGGGQFYARTRGRSETAFAAIRSAVAKVSPTLAVDSLRTVDDQLDRALLNERLLATLASAFAGLAILLAVIGLYGVTSFAASRRTREIGIRLALGATRGAALWLVLRDAAAMVSAGLLIALPVVWGLGRFVASQLYGVEPMDGGTIAGAALLISLVALGASAPPARRAASVSPMEALRHT
jgi:predicted permease